MKRDIFNTLKHSSHELKVIQEGDEILLGCVSCGTTLYSTEDNNCLENLIRAYGICKEQKAYNASEHILEMIFKTDTLQDIVNKALTGDFSEGYRNTLLFSLSNELYNSFESVGINMYEEIINEINNAIIKRKLNKMVLAPNDIYVISNKEIEGNSNSYHRYVTVLDLDVIAKLEEKTPTAKDVITVTDALDFINNIPNYDDEEEENEWFNEFTYRMNNDLYDFSKLLKESKVKILNNSLDYFFDYDYITRHKVIIQKLLKSLDIE